MTCRQGRKAKQKVVEGDQVAGGEAETFQAGDLHNSTHMIWWQTVYEHAENQTQAGSWAIAETCRLAAVACSSLAVGCGTTGWVC